jgi:alkylation response protein AidB-like acyl-CoA dehydrogenase
MTDDVGKTVIWEPDHEPEAQRLLEVAERLNRERFAPLAEELDREQRYPREHIPVLVESGLAGLFVPAEHGGSGASLTAAASVVEEVASACASTAAILSVYALGAFPIRWAGTEEQKQRYLGELATEGVATSFALTEHGAGSDAAAIQATAERVGDGWRLRGEKRFIGNGGASRYYVVFARSDPAAGRRGISAFIVDKEEDSGVVIDHYEDKMGLRGTLTSNLKLDTVVPADRQLGELGKGLRLALETLNAGRITVSGQAIGIGMAAFREAAARAATRETFGSPIIDYQGIGFQLADVATRLSAARMLMHEAARSYDRGGDVSTLGAMAKLFATEASHEAVNVAVQVFGGDGYCKPFPVERYYRDQRITEIYEGTSEIQRVVIARAIKKELAG